VKNAGDSIGASMTLIRVTSLELIWLTMRMVILVADSHSVLVRWRNHFSQLLNIHGVNDVRQSEIPTKEPLMPEPSAFEFELDIENLKGHKSPGNYQIPAELIKADCRTIRYEIQKLISSIWDDEELPKECKVSTIVSIYKMDDKTDCGNYWAYNFCQLRTKFYPTSCCQC
jgi:hypothetical protein